MKKMVICWNCRHLDYDEVYNEETGEEYQYFNCNKGQEAGPDYIECEYFEDLFKKKEKEHE